MGCGSSIPGPTLDGPLTLPHEPRRGVRAGISLRWLRTFAQKVPPAYSTADVVERIIKPETKGQLCRYVALIEARAPEEVATASVFASHTWRAPFRDLVAALCHVLRDDQFVWIDIFAVLQWNREDGIDERTAAEKDDDLNFAAVVKETEVVVLVGAHIESVAQLATNPASLSFDFRVPEEAKQLSCFFRVWCIVEMVAALQAHKPLVMLVGEAAGGDDLHFVPKTSMLANLFEMIDFGRQQRASRRTGRAFFAGSKPQ